MSEAVGSDVALSHVQEREDGRDLRVAELWLKGYSYKRISKVLGLKISTIRDIVDESKKVWLRRKEIVLSEAIAEQLRRVDMIETTAWKAWEESRGEHTEVQVKFTGAKMERIRRTKELAGDPKFLDVALRCVEQRCKLLGVYKPPEERAEMHVWGLTVVVDTPEQAESILEYEQFQSMIVQGETQTIVDDQPGPETPSPGSQFDGSSE